MGRKLWVGAAVAVVVLVAGCTSGSRPGHHHHGVLGAVAFWNRARLLAALPLLRFECAGYTGGTSGSPWVSRFVPRSRTGTIVGVIGGYQEGGDTPSLSYSVHFDSDTRQLYAQALTEEAATGQG